MTVNHPPPDGEDVPPECRLYTAAEVLEVALEGYRRGLVEGRIRAGQDRWRDPVLVDSFRAARIRTETLFMKQGASRRYDSYGYPAGYDYRGGPVDWDTGLPDPSGCAYLRFLRTRGSYGLAWGTQ